MTIQSRAMFKVTLPYDPVWPAVPWAQEHCISYISNRHHINHHNQCEPSKIDYFFGDHRDATIFALRWA